MVDRELLRFIRSLRPDRKTGLISNGWPDLREYISRQHFEDAFDTIVISAEVGLMKPAREIYELALQRLDVRPAEAALVDDSRANVEGANELGMHGILFETPAQARGQLASLLD